MSQIHEPRHPIAVAERRSGLSQQVLRAWERRYGLVVPQRSETGRRLYSDHDLEHLGMLKLLTDAGYRVGSLKDRTVDELRDMAARDLHHVPAPSLARPSSDPGLLIEEALDAIRSLSPKKLEEILQGAAVSLSRPQLRFRFLHPLLESIGHAWQTGEIRIGHEHMASYVIRSFLGSMSAQHRVAPGAPRLVAGTLPGQDHDLGLMLTVSHVEDLGWDVMFLGADLPPEELAGAVHSHSAQVLLTSLVYPAGDPATARNITKLGSLLPSGCLLLVGGQASESYAEALAGSGAIRVENMESLDISLQQASL